MSITADLIRGHTDAIILSQLTAGDSYGYSINRAIRTATEEKYALKEATLYTAFRRLEEAGYTTASTSTAASRISVFSKPSKNFPSASL